MAHNLDMFFKSARLTVILHGGESGYANLSHFFPWHSLRDDSSFCLSSGSAPMNIEAWTQTVMCPPL